MLLIRYIIVNITVISGDTWLVEKQYNFFISDSFPISSSYPFQPYQGERVMPLLPAVTWEGSLELIITFESMTVLQSSKSTHS